MVEKKQYWREAMNHSLNVTDVAVEKLHKQFPSIAVMNEVIGNQVLDFRDRIRDQVDFLRTIDPQEVFSLVEQKIQGLPENLQKQAFDLLHNKVFLTSSMLFLGGQLSGCAESPEDEAKRVARELADGVHGDPAVRATYENTIAPTLGEQASQVVDTGLSIGSSVAFGVAGFVGSIILMYIASQISEERDNVADKTLTFGVGIPFGIGMGMSGGFYVGLTSAVGFALAANIAKARIKKGDRNYNP